MSANAVVCGNCGTENPPDQDECTKCGMPLTGSADQELRAELEEQNDEGLLAVREDAATGTGLGLSDAPPVPPRSNA